MTWLACPHLGADVELTDERWEHIVYRHPLVAILGVETVAKALADPDFIGTRIDCLGFVIHPPGVPRGYSMVVVVRWSEGGTAPATIRHWVVTAWVARRPGPWEVIWERA